MSRPILEEARLHASIRHKVAHLHADIVHNVQSAATSHDVLVVGMKQNPMCKRARHALADAGVTHHYLEYGSYFSLWRKRNALKMWTGWPTFPMVFVRGVLVGGAADIRALIDSGELRRMLSA
ncbi:MAG: glutaredoxin domain-containing protein [Burkholderiaceae bacterium]